MYFNYQFCKFRLQNCKMLPVDKISSNDNLVPNARLITNFGKFAFRSLGCMIFFTMFSVCKARQERLLKNVNKHFHNQQKMKSENGMKSSIVIS